MTKPDFKRLARLVLERRTELGLQQGDVRALGGPSTATQRSIEHGEALGRQIGTTFELERVLGWQPGSVAAILRGGEPRVLSNPDYNHLRRSLPPLLEERGGGPHPPLAPVPNVGGAASRLLAGVDRLTERQVVAVLSVVEAMLPDEEAEAFEPGERAAARQGAIDGTEQG